MNDRDFIFWLHGWFELAGAGTQDRYPDISQNQVQMIFEHITLARIKRKEPDEFSLMVEYIAGVLELFLHIDDSRRISEVKKLVARVQGLFDKVTPTIGTLDHTHDEMVLRQRYQGAIQVGGNYDQSTWGVTCSLDPDPDPAYLSNTHYFSELEGVELSPTLPLGLYQSDCTLR